MAKVKKRKFEPVIDLYDGIKFTLPPLPPEKEIVGYELNTRDQKFKRQKFLHPSEFDKLSRESQLDYLAQEYKYRTEGRWYFINGVPTYFTGAFYFFLNYWYLGADTEDGYAEYRYAQCRWHYFYERVCQDDNCFGGIMMCQRRFAKTEGALSHLYNKASTVGRNDNFGMMSTDGKTAKENLMRDRIIRSHKNIYKYLIPKTHEQGSARDITTLKFVSSQEQDGTQNESLNNNIFYKPTKVDAFQGHRMREIFIDEPGSIDEIDFGVAYRTFKQSLTLGKKIYGRIFLPTTLETLTPRSAPSFKKIWYESDFSDKDLNGRTRSGLYRYFKPYWEGMEGFIDEYGNDMIEESREFIENQYAGCDEDGKRQLRRQYPPTVEAAFDEVVGSQFEEDVMTLLKERKKQIEREKGEFPIFCVKLYENGNDGVGFTPVAYSEDEFIIYEHPRPHVIYKMGIDSTNTDNTTGDKKGSKFAFTILKAFEGIDQLNYTVVAEFARRPERMEDCLMIMYLAAKMYNKFDGMVNGVLPERNVAGASFVGQFLRHRSMEHLVMKEKGSNLYGFYRTGHVKDTQIIKTNLFLRRYGNLLRSIPIIDDLLMVGKQNTDRADSFMGAITALGDFDKKDDGRPTPVIKKKMRILVENGKRVTKWEEVMIGEDGKEVPHNAEGKYKFAAIDTPNYQH